MVRYFRSILSLLFLLAFSPNFGCHKDEPPLDGCTPPPSGLVAWWTGEGSASDIVGNIAPVSVGGVSYPDGYVQKAIHLAGSGRITFPDLDKFKITGSLTIEAWVYQDSAAVGFGSQILFRGDDRGGLDPYTLVILPNGRIQFDICDSTRGNGIDAPFPMHQWVHVAGVFDAAAHDYSIYENGELVSHDTTSILPARNLVAEYHPAVAIGNGNSIYDADEPFFGSIDELALYNRALTGDEIRAIYRAGAGGKCR